MNILVTGATGFVGRAIVEELILNKQKDWEIQTLGRKIAPDPELPNYFSVDISEAENFSALVNLENPSVIIHAAGLAHQFQNPEKKKLISVNVEGTKNILEFAEVRSIRHFILISSVSVYGVKSSKKENKKTNEAAPCFPKDAYASSKLEAEQEAIRICRESNIALTILRLATVVGEGDRGNVSRLIEAIDRKRFLMIGRGENCKTLIYKNDVGRACRHIMEKKDWSVEEAEIFNVVAEPVQMKNIVATIRAALGQKKTRLFVPANIIKPPVKLISNLVPSRKFKSFSETLEKWTSNEIFSGEKIKKKYSFEPQTDVLEAIKWESSFYKTDRKC